MSVTSNPAEIDVPVRLLTDEEARAEFDLEARHWLGISGEEFLRRWRAGEYANRLDEFPVMQVAFVLPLVLPDNHDA